jgi:hypothetical protein
MMDLIMKDNGNKTKEMDSESMLEKMVLLILVYGNRMNVMDLENSILILMIIMKENLNKIKEKEMDLAL